MDRFTDHAWCAPRKLAHYVEVTLQDARDMCDQFRTFACGAFNLLNRDCA
ncbi:hypothetical protein SIO92_000121 [Burkholderia cenocepacia]|nr:hypothetical protein [Burkholderia cenocepacia]